MKAKRDSSQLLKSNARLPLCVYSGEIALTFVHADLQTVGHARVIREVARQGLLPYPEFFASTRPFGTPLGPVVLKFVLTALVIFALPARDAFNFLLDLASYPNMVSKCVACSMGRTQATSADFCSCDCGRCVDLTQTTSESGDGADRIQSIGYINCTLSPQLCFPCGHAMVRICVFSYLDITNTPAGFPPRKVTRMYRSGTQRTAWSGSASFLSVFFRIVCALITF